MRTQGAEWASKVPAGSKCDPGQQRCRRAACREHKKLACGVLRTCSGAGLHPVKGLYKHSRSNAAAGCASSDASANPLRRGNGRPARQVPHTQGHAGCRCRTTQQWRSCCGRQRSWRDCGIQTSCWCTAWCCRRPHQRLALIWKTSSAWTLRSPSRWALRWLRRATAAGTTARADIALQPGRVAAARWSLAPHRLGKLHVRHAA